MDVLEQFQQRAPKMIKRLQHLSHKEGQRELGLLSLEKKRLKGDLITMYKYLMGGKKDGARLFPVVPSGRKRHHEHKLKERKFHLNIKFIFFL